MEPRPPGYIQYANSMVYTDELLVAAPRGATRRHIAEQAGILLEEALLDGIDTDAPIWVGSRYQRSFIRNTTEVTVTLDAMPRAHPPQHELEGVRPELTEGPRRNA